MLDRQCCPSPSFLQCNDRMHVQVRVSSHMPPHPRIQDGCDTVRFSEITDGGGCVVGVVSV